MWDQGAPGRAEGGTLTQMNGIRVGGLFLCITLVFLCVCVVISIKKYIRLSEYIIKYTYK